MSSVEISPPSSKSATSSAYPLKGSVGCFAPKRDLVNVSGKTTFSFWFHIETLFQDIDSDNDGIYDVVEAGNGYLDTNNDGVIDSNDTGFSDNDNNGMADSSENTSPIDSDNDGIADYLDLDSDNDGINDVIEDENIDVSETRIIELLFHHKKGRFLEFHNIST